MRMPPVDKTAKWPENHRFVGEPSAEIDDNWMGLLEDRYFSISEEEAAEAWGDRRHDYVDEEHGGYTAGLDVFHTLHCLVSLFSLSFSLSLCSSEGTSRGRYSIAARPVNTELTSLPTPQNEVRMALFPEHYNHHGMPVETQAAHTEHCLDSIRQHIQCYGSTTLIPTRWRETAGRQYIDSDQEHVCRDFSYLRKFVRRRSAEGDLYVQRDKSLISKGEEEEAGDKEGEAAGELKAVEGKDGE